MLSGRGTPFIAGAVKLHSSLEGYEPQVPLRDQHLGLWASVLNSLGGSGGGGADKMETAGDAPRGVYMHGGVGTGKTFMMDLFFQVILYSQGLVAC